MKLELHVDTPEAASRDEARRVLGRLFPTAGAYVFQSPKRTVEVTFSDPADQAADPLAIWEALIPVPGRYRVAPADEFRKAIDFRRGADLPVKPFQDWWLEQLVAAARTHATSVDEVVTRAIEDFIRDHGGSLADPAVVQEFEQLLFDLRQGIRWSVANPVSPDIVQALRQLGFTDRHVLDFPGVAFRLGVIDAELRAPGARFSWPQVLQMARQAPVFPSDTYAMEYARARAGALLTPVVLRNGQALSAEAAEREQQLLRTMTREAIARQMHPRAFARELYKRLGRDESIVRDWERVARTEIGEARNRGAYEAERRARGWTSETLIYRNLSATPCSGCLKLYKQPDGMPRRYPVAFVEAEDAKGYNRGHWREWHVRIGLTHPNCFPGSTQAVGLGISGTTERRYDGDLIVLKTASGNELACTPNHPILTLAGWVPARAMNVGSNVVGCRLRDGVVSRDVDGKQMPSALEDVARAFRESLQVTSVPVPLAAEDFHGDGVGSQVAVVRAKRLLTHHVDAATLKELGEEALAQCAEAAALLASLCASAQFFQRALPAAYGLVAGGRLGEALLARHPRMPHAVCLARAARIYAVLAESSADGFRLRVEDARQSLRRFAGNVAGDDVLGRQRKARGRAGGFDPRAHWHPELAKATGQGRPRHARVADQGPDTLARTIALGEGLDIDGDFFADPITLVRRRQFVGHVYNLTTTSGAYIAEGIVVHNCRDSPWQTWTPALAGIFAAQAGEWKATYARRGIEEATA